MNARNLILSAYVYAVLLFIILPIVIIMPMAFSTTDYLTFPPRGFTLHWFGDFFNDPEWTDSARLSLVIALLVSVTTAVVGTMATYALQRGRGRIRLLFQTLLMGPIIVPHIALAVALSLFFGTIGLSGSVLSYVLAHSVIAMPFTVFTVAAALARVDRALEDAAMSCGAPRFTAFRLVTLPLILPNVLSGALFAFIISFDEPVITFFLAGIRDKTLPRMMFDNIEQNLTPVIPVTAVLLTLLSVAVLVATAFLQRRGRTAAPAGIE